MSFSAFTEEDVTKIIDHRLELQSQKFLDAIVERFGSLETYRTSVAENLKDESRVAEFIKIYGSKDKVVDASLAATGNMDEQSEGLPFSIRETSENKNAYPVCYTG